MAEETVLENQEPSAPAPPATPVANPRFAVSPNERRFLFVDIAALRAKQLRRGALNRLQAPGESPRPDLPRKAERIAMEELKRGFISYELPEAKVPGTPEGKQ